ncbi:hypothetical protein BH10PSE14_BH10PSE14_06350 [soil metagenome]
MRTALIIIAAVVTFAIYWAFAVSALTPEDRP